MYNKINIKIQKKITTKIKDFEKKEWHLADIEHYGQDRNFVKKKYKLVATSKDGEVLGILDLVTEANVGFVESLLVGSKHKKQGIGKKLILTAEDVAIKNRCSKIWTETDEGWGAEEFYKKNNYKITGVHENHYLNRRGLIFTKYF